MYWIGVLLAIIGAGGILFALGFISAVLGGLINGMIVLMAGPLVDGFLAKRSRRAQPSGG